MALNLSGFLTEAEKVAHIVGIGSAGAWAYYHYFRGRTYRPRLDLGVSGTMSQGQSLDSIVATVTVKNVGLSRLIVEQEGTALVVSTCEIPTEPFMRVQWTAQGAYPIFEKHSWIEPGEIIQNKVLVNVQPNQAPVLLELRVNAAGIAWSVDEIVRGVAGNVTFDKRTAR